MQDITFIPDFNFATVAQRYVEDGLLNHLVHESFSLEKVVSHLCSNPNLVCIDIDGYFVGFWSMEEGGVVQGVPLIEIHVYMLPEFRRYSLNVLNFIKQLIFNSTPFGAIITTVPDDYKRVIPVLEKRLGFVQLHYEPNMLRRNGSDLGLNYLILKKE